MKQCGTCGLRRPRVNGKQCAPCATRAADYASDALVTLDTVADELGVSMQHAARIEAAALAKIRVECDRLGLRLEDLVP